MSNPNNPNFKPGVGRLATDRFDMQDHIEGKNFRHPASAIDMNPIVTFDEFAPTNVQDAIAALAQIVSPPTIQLATESYPGIVQLSNLGDIGGSALAMRVVKLQGVPVLSSSPSNGDVLVFSSGAWGPSGATFAFVAGNDLSGTNTFQNVVGLSGQSGQVNVHCGTITWDTAIGAPTINQQTAAAAGGPFTIQAQASGNGSAGGNLVLLGGFSATDNFVGGTILGLGDGTKMLQAGNTGNGRVIALFDQDLSLGTSLPFGTGDLVVYMANAATPPSVPPGGGVLLYSHSGDLWVMQSDGGNFPVGSIPNPSTWGTTGGPYNIGTPPSIGNAQEYTYRYSAQTTTNAAATLNFSIPNSTAVKVDVMFVGKQSSTNTAAEYNLSMGFVTDGSGNVSAVGALTSADPRFTSGASSWTGPNVLSPSAGTIQVATGFHTSTTINWTIIVQLVMSQG